MGIESMRVGGGRCPSLLVGVLIIICLMMVCNWWTLSSTNLELLRQIDELNEQIKISVEERDQCVTQRALFEKQLKGYIDDARTTHVRLSQIEDNLSTCNEELQSHKRVDITRTATLEALRVDKEAISAQLDAKKKENKKLEEELKKVQDEFDKLKLSIKAQSQKNMPLLPIAGSTVISKPHLGPVERSAVQISAWGQEGLQFHGIPILPQDPPGAMHLTPHFSVTKLKNKIAI